MVCGHREECLFRSIHAFAPQIELPIGECAIELIDTRIFDDDSPIANARLAPWNALALEARRYLNLPDLPVHYRHKGPIHIALRIVVQTSCCA